jgi:hypothetical protein
MSTQNANAVVITGGTVNGTTIGGTTAAVGTFSTLNTANAAITGGTITGITDLTVADGGTGASSITANSVILGNGTSALSGNLVAPSTSGNVLTSNGTTWTSAANPKVTSGTAQTTTSGTFFDFTSIPSTVKRITVMLNGVSTNGTSLLIVRLGTSGGIVSSGYTSRSGYSFGGSVVSNTTGVTISDSQDAPDLVIGQFVISNISGNQWVITGNFAQTSQNKVTTSNGIINLGGTLDRVRITTVNGTDTFDAGSINILYE